MNGLITGRAQQPVWAEKRVEGDGCLRIGAQLGAAASRRGCAEGKKGLWKNQNNFNHQFTGSSVYDWDRDFEGLWGTSEHCFWTEATLWRGTNSWNMKFALWFLVLRWFVFCLLSLYHLWKVYQRVSYAWNIHTFSTLHNGETYERCPMRQIRHEIVYQKNAKLNNNCVLYAYISTFLCFGLSSIWVHLWIWCHQWEIAMKYSHENDKKGKISVRPFSW